MTQDYEQGVQNEELTTSQLTLPSCWAPEQVEGRGVAAARHDARPFRHSLTHSLTTRHSTTGISGHRVLHPAWHGSCS